MISQEVSHEYYGFFFVCLFVFQNADTKRKKFTLRYLVGHISFNVSQQNLFETFLNFCQRNLLESQMKFRRRFLINRFVERNADRI